jgi:hypothetical protein
MQSLGDDIEAVFGDIAAEVPRLSTHDAEFVFSRGNLPSPPSEVSTNALWFRPPLWHTYNSFPVPSVDLCIDKSGCRLLGLLILAVVFHPEPETVELHLRHHESQIDLLRVRHEQASWSAGYKTTPESYSYWPGMNERHPWAGWWANRAELPVIEITTRDELGPVNRRDYLAGCDTVIGFGHDLSAVRMAELLLNASLDDNDQVEFDLEGEVGGNPSLAVGSAEMQIWLPGGLGYIDSNQ